MQTVYTEWINKKVSLYSTVNYLQYPVINHNGKEYEKELLFGRLQLFVTPWTAACQTSWSFTISQSLLKLVSIESVMPSNHLILFHSLSSCPQSFPTSGCFLMRWPKYWNFSFSISPFSGYSGLISFRTDWLDPLTVQGTLKSLLQHHS